MKYIILHIFSLILICFSVSAQDSIWNESNKKQLIDNYKRTRNEINNQTKGLSIAQWNFKESNDSWSIAEVMEHLNMWHLITQDQIRFMLYNGPQPELAKIAPTDSAVTSFIYEEKKHISPDLTIPTGQIPDTVNLKLFNFYTDRIIENINSSNINFTLYFRRFTDGYMTNMNQGYIIHYGHVDRHLRQIKKIKSNVNFPE